MRKNKKRKEFLFLLTLILSSSFDRLRMTEERKLK
jgi:hypothetical protein